MNTENDARICEQNSRQISKQAKEQADKQANKQVNRQGNAGMNTAVNSKREHLKNKKLFLFDIDGTIALSEDVIEGTIELLSYIREIGGRAIYITNNSSKSTADYVKKFRRMGIEAFPEDFVTAGSYTLSYLTGKHQEDLIFVMATASYLAELRKMGLQVTERYSEDVDVVLTAFDTELTYEKIEEACRLLMDDTKERIWLATNADLRCPVDFGMIPDCGSICNMISAATDRKPVYLGKPSPGLVEYSMKVTGFTKEETLVVGDRIYTDIACGENAGVETCLVFTGEAKAEDVPGASNRIDFYFDSVKELYEEIVS